MNGHSGCPFHVHGFKDRLSSAAAWVAAKGCLLKHHQHGGADFASTSFFLSICKPGSAALLTVSYTINVSSSL